MITQEDRDTFAAVYAVNCPKYAAEISAGKYDATPLVQAFAAHRAAAYAKGVEDARAWFANDAKLCDCFARSDTECACGAWDDRKAYDAEKIEAGFRALKAGPNDRAG